MMCIHAAQLRLRVECFNATLQLLKSAQGMCSRELQQQSQQKQFDLETHNTEMAAIDFSVLEAKNESRPKIAR